MIGLPDYVIGHAFWYDFLHKVEYRYILSHCILWISRKRFKICRISREVEQLRYCLVNLKVNSNLNRNSNLNKFAWIRMCLFEFAIKIGLEFKGKIIKKLKPYVESTLPSGVWFSTACTIPSHGSVSYHHL